PWRDGEALSDPRINTIVIGPGLGQGEAALTRFDAALASGKSLVIDADALALLSPSRPLGVPTIVTPHAGEFARLFSGEGSKIAATRALAQRHGAVVIHKGADTVIAAPDGRVAVHAPGDPWLSCAGTGDVLAGICGAMLARGLDAFDAAQAAVLLHGRAARRAGPGLIADDLVAAPIWP
ncbi:MAG: ADP/ATP-dependent (S)-NAD(P)H-hydrate dehydratase, partial [Sphingopyxis sp.]